ncbi:MAG: hypothetical protein FJ387_21390 [Verrucomicrobia bacterium]|nr:hypothetical protein [Verrucomicrobiota bacterium]
MKLMLDVHLDPGLTDALRRRWPKLDVQSATEPGLSVLSDPLLLEMLAEEGRVLVTRDVNTMPEHVKTRMCAGLMHGGVIFVPRTIAQTDTRQLLRELTELIEREGDADWRSRVCWLRA